MLNSCVKNVRNQRINNSISSCYIYTDYQYYLNNISKWCINYNFTNLNINNLISHLSTSKNHIINLLNKSFTHYPHHLLIRLIKEN